MTPNKRRTYVKLIHKANIQKNGETDDELAPDVDEDEELFDENEDE